MNSVKTSTYPPTPQIISVKSKSPTELTVEWNKLKTEISKRFEESVFFSEDDTNSFWHIAANVAKNYRESKEYCRTNDGASNIRILSNEKFLKVIEYMQKKSADCAWMGLSDKLQNYELHSKQND